LRRALAAAAAVLLIGGVVAGCSSGSSNGDAKVDVKKGGKELSGKTTDNSFSIGDAELPKSFPTGDVPLPEAGELKAVVSGTRAGHPYFSLTYSVKSGDLKSVASNYKQALKTHGYAIESSSSVGGSSGSFAAFTAVGPDWDVIAYSGGTADAGGALSLQVTAHDPSKDLPGS
jgi:hypothetical protein